MLWLYHFGAAICAQKVRIALAEKNVAWESKDCSGPGLRDPEYLKLNPTGVVPTLVHNDLVLAESRIISEYISDVFDGPTLMPAGPSERYRARFWTKQIDDSLHLNIFILTFAGGMREMFLPMSPEVRKTALPGLRDPIKRRITNEMMESGWDNLWVAMATSRFHRLLTDMENCLAQSEYLAGPTYSLADADYTPYLARLVDIGFGSLLEGKPAVQDWWCRMQERPSYKAAILDWGTPQDAQRYQVGRERYAVEIRSLIQAA